MGALAILHECTYHAVNPIFVWLMIEFPAGARTLCDWYYGFVLLKLVELAPQGHGSDFTEVLNTAAILTSWEGQFHAENLSFGESDIIEKLVAAFTAKNGCSVPNDENTACSPQGDRGSRTKWLEESDASNREDPGKSCS
ncbi:hypothetical protein PC128_g18695 [Phytophthora cactorum]|nr:hypothetical protein PC120_g16289 [Phytophthora cactorum]KAG3171561.1 hypothetical protein PC128_g18695 [Phytophthora cactorum]KAG4048458.1 hypothetical protein PC123_g16227 [Phytophthora cactorum]